jgi:hypothetical protein
MMNNKGILMNLSDPNERRKMSFKILEQIDEYCAETYNAGFRNHLGASQIGHNCSRYLWYQFRWIAHKKHSGRQQRLFQRGHLEEARFCEWLRGIGVDVSETAEDGKQHRVSACCGHAGGSLDGIGILPELDEKVLLEFKTSGTGSKFNKLLQNGVEMERQQHFSQMSFYGYKKQLQYALYLCINKNDDDLHVELIKLNWELGKELEEKAQGIIKAITPPEKLSQSSTFWQCKSCDFFEVCHGDEKPMKNCRSCVNSSPVDDGQWSCSTFGIIPKEFIKTGCDEWDSIC